MNRKLYVVNVIAASLAASMMISGCSSLSAGLRLQNEGIQAMKSGDLQTAADDLQKSLDSNSAGDSLFYRSSGKNETRRYLASCYLQLGDYAKALKLTKDLLGDDPDDPDVLQIAGAAYALSGDTEKAKKSFDSAVSADSDNWERVYGIAKTMESCSMKDDATEYFDSADLSDDSSMDAALRGEILCFLGRYDEAVSALEGADMTDEDTVSALAQAYLGQKQYDKVLSLYDGLGSSLKSKPQMLNMEAAAQIGKGNYDDALTTISSGLEKAGDDSSAKQALLYNQICAYEYKGDFDKAKELMATYLTSYPGDESAQRENIFLQTR